MGLEWTTQFKLTKLKLWLFWFDMTYFLVRMMKGEVGGYLDMEARKEGLSDCEVMQNKFLVNRQHLETTFMMKTGSCFEKKSIMRGIKWYKFAVTYLSPEIHPSWNQSCSSAFQCVDLCSLIQFESMSLVTKILLNNSVVQCVSLFSYKLDSYRFA